MVGVADSVGAAVLVAVAVAAGGSEDAEGVSSGLQAASKTAADISIGHLM